MLNEWIQFVLFDERKNKWAYAAGHCVVLAAENVAAATTAAIPMLHIVALDAAVAAVTAVDKLFVDKILLIMLLLLLMVLLLLILLL